MHPLRKLRESGPHTAADVEPLLADAVTFHSPIFSRTVQGRTLVATVFAASAGVRSGRFVAEYRLDERTTFIRWQGIVDGRKLESLELILDDEHGKIVDRTVALRPYPAVKLFREALYPALRELIPASYWDYEPEEPSHESTV
jgi:hypothetical protein